MSLYWNVGPTDTGHFANFDDSGRMSIDAATVPMVRSFPVYYNDANLYQGRTLYTPAPGEYVMNAWVQIVATWDGTTPTGDLWVEGSSNGWLRTLTGHSWDMTQLDADNFGVGLSNQVAIGEIDLITAQIYSSGSTPFRFIPGQFYNSQPLQFVVSTDGTPTTDPGSTQGQANIYIVTFNPGA